MMNAIETIYVLQGEYQVASRENVVLSTILGSCVAACLRDPTAAVGGMNHFLLPGVGESHEGERYGAYLMELLINGLLKKGARRERIEAKLFGGARMLEGLSDIGSQNAAFAKSFLTEEGIRIVAEDFGGSRGRRLEFFPLSGRARQILLPRDSTLIDRPNAPKFIGSGLLELF
jgi:chemotaxis protein CheD